MKKYTRHVIVPALALIIGFTGIAEGQVPEIPNTQLQDIAIVRPYPPYRAIIIYNPVICRRIGVACGFFKAHEYGHIALNHQFMHPSAYPAYREASADCWAASNAAPEEIYAAYRLFSSGGSSRDWRVYGNPLQRAERVRACAIRAGRWMGG